MDRASGVLLHPTSFPSRFGIGDLGPEAYHFIDWLAGADQRYWQVLPLGPTDAGNSPYQSPSAFAGNPLLMSPDKLAEDGLLTADELKDFEVLGAWNTNKINFDLVRLRKQQMIERAVGRFRELHEDHPLQAEFRAFVVAQGSWLEDMALFMALREANPGRAWTDWTVHVDSRKNPGPEARSVLREPILFHRIQQFLFFRQWKQLRDYARERKIRIIGDVPIYVSHDSADVWSNRQFFQLDERGHSTQVAGVPPDYFSATGQLWNNPLYDWDALDRDRYRWWVARIRAVLETVDIVRLDHFRGFEAYWSVPAGQKTAENGMWVTGPGHRFFQALKESFATPENYGELPLIAEDLGTITEPVEALRHAFHLPGMNVLQFMLLADETINPHEFEAQSVVYTGTHDNDTTLGWFRTFVAPLPYQLERLRRYVPVENETSMVWELIGLAWHSSSAWAVVPLQDLFTMGSDSRMNTPGTSGDDIGNWTWQYCAGTLTPEVQTRLRDLTHAAGRAS